MDKSDLTAGDCEAQRHQREMENQNSPFLKLPGELRNQIYELAVPQGQIFNTGSTDAIKLADPAGTKHRCHSIQRRRPHRHQFAITQVCRQLRKDTLKLIYGSNTYMLRIVYGDDGKPENEDTIGDAARWIASRPQEALPFISRVVLQLWDLRDHSWRKGEEAALFDMSQGSAQVMRLPIEGPSISNIGSRFPRALKRDINIIDLKAVLSEVDTSAADSEPSQALLQLIAAFCGSF